MSAVAPCPVRTGLLNAAGRVVDVSERVLRTQCPLARAEHGFQCETEGILGFRFHLQSRPWRARPFELEGFRSPQAMESIGFTYNKAGKRGKSRKGGRRARGKGSARVFEPGPRIPSGKSFHYHEPHEHELTEVMQQKQSDRVLRSRTGDTRPVSHRDIAHRQEIDQHTDITGLGERFDSEQHGAVWRRGSLREADVQVALLLLISAHSLAKMSSV
ncbi:hypothetical protein C8Q80DRAFT_1124110 [Daedaleopsis nitida]|nr:hypothetical protein C8Q80DRAFT_1124110 [Daedaleopsis nitida]